MNRTIPICAVEVQTEDAEVVLRVRRGDREAYSDLVRRYQATLYRYIRSLGPDHDASMDIVQDTFIRGYTHLDQCRDPGRVRAWLFRIGRNLCFDFMKNLRQRTVSLSEPEGEAERRELPESDVHALRAALDALAPELREAFLLRHDAGYTYDEAAEIVGVSTSAVKMRVHRARRMLLAFLGPEGREKDCDEPAGVSRLWE
jgi:RNA polymerase sigma-70 factor (ECF subfamily)